MAQVTEEHLRVRLHTLQILSGKEDASLLLMQVGDAIKKQTGQKVKGKLKHILALFPADFWIDTQDKVVLLSNQTPPGRPIVSPQQEPLHLPPSRSPSNVLPTVTLQKQKGKASQAGAVLPAWVGNKLNSVASQSGASSSSASASTSQTWVSKPKAPTPVTANKVPTPVTANQILETKKRAKLPVTITQAPVPLTGPQAPVQVNQTREPVSSTRNDAAPVPATKDQAPVPSTAVLVPQPLVAPESSSQVLVITDKEALAAAVQSIAQHSTIAIDCEGCNLSRTGRLCLIQVALPPPKPCVYLLDLVSMDSDTLEALKQSLGTILEDRSVTKVIHDCRQDSDALFHQLGIRLDGVFDTQASYVALVKARKAQARSTSGFVPLPGLNQLLKEYTGKENSAKQDGKVLMERDPSIWEKRPLRFVLLQYAAQDVMGLFAVQAGILRDCSKLALAQLSLASSEYVGAFRNNGGSGAPPSGKQRMAFDKTGSLVPLSELTFEDTAPEESNSTEDDLAELLALLPVDFTAELAGGGQRLMEIVLDFGRRPVARFLDGSRAFLAPEVVSRADLDSAVQRLGAFGSDNRAGVPGTLHRISALRERDSGEVLGLTYRVGRAVLGSASMARDMLKTGGNILLLGPPMTGKTTIIRDLARLLSDDSWVVIVDTSNEIAGAGPVAHASVGNARRMQVKNLESQFATMIECVQNHAPEVIVIDEIGRKKEAEAARTIAQRGVRLIASAHGSLASLVSNPFLSELLGGVDLVTVGDSAANKLYNGRKNVQQRKRESIFQTIIELAPERLSEWAIFNDVETKVDKILKGEPFEAEIRVLDTETGTILVGREIRVPQ